MVIILREVVFVRLDAAIEYYGSAQCKSAM